MKFRTGDLVSHKSNKSIIMTVIKVKRTGYVCRWVDAQGIQRVEKFAEAELDFYKKAGTIDGVRIDRY